MDYESEAEDDMLRISRKGEGNHLLPLFDCFSLVYFAAEVFQMFAGSTGYKEVGIFVFCSPFNYQSLNYPWMLQCPILNIGLSLGIYT